MPLYKVKPTAAPEINTDELGPKTVEAIVIKWHVQAAPGEPSTLVPVVLIHMLTGQTLQAEASKELLACVQKCADAAMALDPNFERVG